MAKILIEREVIFAEDVEKIFGKRPWASRSEEIFGNSENTEKSKSEAAEENAADAAADAGTADTASDAPAEQAAE